MLSRRAFLSGFLGLASVGGVLLALPRKYLKWFLLEAENLTTPKMATSSGCMSDVFVCKNGTPQENVAKVLEIMGGIQRFIGVDDIVVLKPGAQWWNQGRTNLAAMKGFIDLVLGIPGFKGEVIVAENQHFMDDSLPEGEKDNVRGWTEIAEINGDIDGVNHSLSSLVSLYQEQGVKNVTKYQWRDGGPKAPVWGNGQNGGIVSSPAEGDGYVWAEDDYVFKGLWGFKKWKTKMTYPIFTSAYSGITIDFKNGAYQRDGKGGGQYLKEKPFKFVNFSVLNDHGSDTGITGAIKNYMGVMDMSCGWWGLEPTGYVNVHECGGDYYPHAKAGPIGHFMKNIRAADLNIVTAEWVGWGSRIDVEKASRMKTILAGKDPVALDYHGARAIVYPLSKKPEHHDPDNSRSAVAKFLSLAQSVYGQGVLKSENIKLHEHDFTRG
jgi:hypothetical protein